MKWGSKDSGNVSQRTAQKEASNGQCDYHRPWEAPSIRALYKHINVYYWSH